MPKKTGPRLESRRVLLRFVCREFGYDEPEAMLAMLRGASAGVDSGGESGFARALPLRPDRATVTAERLAEYDANVAGHSRRLRMTGEHGRSWKPHQWLALLFTEHYLRRWFDDAEALRAELNAALRKGPFPRFMAAYEPDDLRTLAFQSATGSGKTLLMHAHILQYRHRLRRAGGRLNNAVLVTPNEQLSAQHARELAASGLGARLLSGAAGGDLAAPIAIIDLPKLAERKGVKRVAAADFGENNLVLVDEGHLGASGKAWRERRKELARGGFAFEYSATFDQIAGADDGLADAYGKCLLFDYPYRTFHAEGYGKDYHILNLPGGAQDENAETYLTGCLLAFFQQSRLWREHGAAWREFEIARPLLAFLGKTVTGSSKADRETRSDVVRILEFLGRALARGGETRDRIARLLAGRSGLVDEDGREPFAGRFPHVPADGDVYGELCETLFHGAGRLRVVYPTAGAGELHLRVADNPPFGVVNVGDSTGLHKLLADAPSPHFDVERERGFAERLFAGVDRADSPVNVVVGARRFIAGWNSWRVSAMGLMHVGVKEGPEIVQMFGRGVRLKGWRGSLKRHRDCPGAPAAENGEGLALLETLHIFGLRANYMSAFRELLAKQGAPLDRETIELKTKWSFPRPSGLRTIRLEKDADWERSGERIALPPPGGADSPAAVLDLRSRLQARASAPGPDEDGGGRGDSLAAIAPGRMAFLDRTRIYDRVLARKRRMGWSNLAIDRGTVDRLLDSDEWYTLHAPPERLAPRGFAGLQALEDVAVDLVADYAERFWRRARRRWEHERIEVGELDESDPNNVRAYAVEVDARNAELADHVRELARHPWGGFARTGLESVATVGAHAYEPLLCARAGCEVEVRPAPLNRDEGEVVKELERLARKKDSRLGGRELFLIRNTSRGGGLSFFDDFAYYPDFIVWLKGGAVQHMIFLDPKGLARLGPREREKVRLHRGIKEVEKRAREKAPGLRLHAYILSATPPDGIDDGKRAQGAWEKDGVYFLADRDCLGKVAAHALGAKE